MIWPRIRRIAGDEEFGEEHEIGTVAGGVGARLARFRKVAGNVADGRVQLCNGNAKCRLFKAFDHVPNPLDTKAPPAGGA